MLRADHVFGSVTRSATALCSIAILALVCFSSGRVSSAPVRQPEPAAQCTLTQAKPLYVAFAEGMTLESFELAALSSRHILRSIKADICALTSSGRSTALLAPSLRAALRAHSPLETREVAFEDRGFARAHVVLREIAPGLGAWRAELARHHSSWTLLGTREQRD